MTALAREALLHHFAAASLAHHFLLFIINVNYTMFDTFPIVDATTVGGPAQSTTTLVYKVYQDGYVGLNLGSSSAQSVLLMLIVMVLTFVQFRFVERRVQY